ncbi:hypothetical protein BDM02DRAFT_3155659 [Thelephora ganbajun]|uniref:Uncharacterized protein n=1 Tax=Thelephora ganbajun TaxID=370292 RepID=A0ACB6ZFX2_THEGA|nr:hypothetical protein BDM02DRAFT_3155659 [Thelephora ganbajun]
MSTKSNVDVLIIGAGPAGLMCAHGLARAGVNVRIVDQRPSMVPAGQADGIQPRTIEVLQSYGLAERLLREGNQMHMAAFYNPGPNGGIERTGRAPDVTASTARYPFEVTLHQGAIESIFLDSLYLMGRAVERPIKPTSIELSQNEAELRDPRAYPVKVHLKRLNAADEQSSTEIVNARFVVGADGAHSWVRKNFGIQMEGEQTEYIWGVIDTVPETNFPDIRNRCVIHSESGSCMVIPREGDKVRLYIQLSDKQVVDSATGRVDKGRVSTDHLLQAVKKIIKPYTIDVREIEWWTIYIIGQRVASKFSIHDRVFIAGDACHTHSPKAGQGMNASMNDTHNLIWKLVHILRGWADISLLKFYEFERRKYAQDLINFDRQFSALFSGKPRTQENQDGVSHERFLETFQTFGGFTSGIGIHYAPSTITDVTYQFLAPGLPIGQRIIPQILIRAPDSRPYELQDLCPADAKFKILIFLGDIADPVQAERAQKFAEALGKPGSFLSKYGRTKPGMVGWKVFDLLTICATRKEVVNYLDVPAFLRPHWTKVFVDDVSIALNAGGRAYSTYGIDRNAGATVVVRPDGYVGIVAPLEDVGVLNTYFAGFMTQRSTASSHS